MKCPYRPIVTTVENVTRTEFAECLRNECPYYGIKNLMIHPERGIQVEIDPGCKKVELEEKEAKRNAQTAR